MKTAIRVSAVALVVVMLAMVLASCGGLSGTYKSEEVFGAYTTYEFTGNNVKVTVHAGILGSESEEGTYKIDGDIITFTFDDESKDFSFEKTEDGIKIAGVEYKKQK